MHALYERRYIFLFIDVTVAEDRPVNTSSASVAEFERLRVVASGNAVSNAKS
jgi:hypothetical protein